MQDLIFEFYSKSTDDFQFWIRDNIEHLLKKEKEQIMEAWYNGFDELKPFVDHSEEYYNKTYNQKLTK